MDRTYLLRRLGRLEQMIIVLELKLAHLSAPELHRWKNDAGTRQLLGIINCLEDAITEQYDERGRLLDRLYQFTPEVFLDCQ